MLAEECEEYLAGSMFSSTGLQSEQGDRDSNQKPEVATEKMKNGNKHINGGAPSESNVLVDENSEYIALTGQDFSSMTADSFCVFKSCDGKMFRLEKKTILQSSAGCDTFCGMKTSEKNIKGPYVLEFCADVLEAAFNFLRGYFWDRIDLPTILGLWKFGHQFGHRGIKANAQVDVGVQAHNVDLTSRMTIARTARQVSALDVEARMHEIYVASRWSTSSDFKLAAKEFAGFDQREVERIATLVIAKEKKQRTRCGAICEPRNIDGTKAVFGTRACEFSPRKSQLLCAIVAWLEGEGDAEPMEKLRIANNLCPKIISNLGANMMERDLSAMLETAHGASLGTMDLVAYLRLMAHKQDLEQRFFERCDRHTWLPSEVSKMEETGNI